MAGDDAGAESTTPGNPAGFIAYHLSIGSSGREMLREWRDLGGTASDHGFYRLIGQVQDTIDRTDNMAALDPSAVPSGGDYGEWSAGRGGQFATQVSVTYIDNETGLRSSAPYTYITDEAHTPEEAEAAAMDEYGADDVESRYGQTVTGAFTVHVWQTVPFG